MSAQPLRTPQGAPAIDPLAEELLLTQRLTRSGSWRYDLVQGTVLWSPELFRVLGLPVPPPRSEAEVVWRPAPPFDTHHELFTAESWALISAAVEAATTGQDYELPCTFVGPDGETRHGLARGQARRDASGEVVLLVGTFQDVHDVVAARAQADIARARESIATRVAGAGVWDWDVIQDELYWNARMFELYDQPPTEEPVAYSYWRDRVHPDDVEQAEAAIQRALSGDGRFDHTFRVMRRDGRTLIVRGQGDVMRAPDGTAVRMIGVNIDTTEQVLTAQRLARHEALLLQFVHHAPAAIAMLDRDLRYVAASDRWMQDYGLGEQDLRGRSHYEVFPSVPQLWKDIHQDVLRGHVQRCDEDSFPQPDGSIEWIRWEARPWHEGDGSIGGLLLFTQHITEQKRMEQTLREQGDQLRQANAELLRSNDDLQRFAYAASHDLQEPLRAVSGCAQLLDELYRDRLDAQGHELLEHVVGGAQRMSTLIHDLLSYSRVQATAERIREPVRISDCLEAAVSNLQAAITEAEACLDVSAPDEAHVMGDAGQLTIVLQNVLGNALKYRTAAPPRISIRVERDPGASPTRPAWLVRVRDHGIGIPPAHRERVFELFKRLHTRTEYPGTGIGLSLCRRVIEQHDGRIWIADIDGPGTEVRFTLPAARA